MNPDLPQNWAEVPLGELNQFASKTVDPSEFPQETFELYSVPSFPTGKPEIVAGTSIGSTKQSVEPGDVLVCKINPRINRVWQVRQAQQHRQIASSEWIGFRCAPLDHRFFRHFFSSPDFRELICTDVTGVGGSLTRAQPKKVATFPVPVAPLAEQTRIADQLDKLLARVQACNERLDAIPALLKRFRRAVLAAATSGELIEGDASGANWLDTTIGAIAVDLRYGTSKKCDYSSVGTGVLRIPNIADHGRIDIGDLKRAEFDIKEIDKLALREGDLLVIRSNGSVDLVGKTSLVTAAESGLLFAGYLMRLRVDQAQAMPAFIQLCLSAPAQRQYIERTAKSTSGVNNLNAEELRALLLRLPSLTEQAKIVRRVEALFTFADRLEARYTTAHAQVEKLTPSLLAKAFRGELVPQDPNDETASVLLERIASKRSASEIQLRRRQSTAGHKPTRAPKENTAVTKSRQDEDVQGKPYLAQHLRLLGGSASAEALFKVSELPVADFYKQLAWEVAQGHVRDGKTVLELADAA